MSIKNVSNKHKIGFVVPFIVGIIFFTMLFCAKVSAEELYNDEYEENYNNGYLTRDDLQYQIIRASSNGLSFKISGMMPIGAYFTVEELDSEEIKDCQDAINKSVREGLIYGTQKAYDIVLYDEYDNEYQPQDYGETVEITIIDKEISPYVEKNIFRMEQTTVGEIDLNTVTELETTKQMGQTVSFETEHFTTFTVNSINYDTENTSESNPPYVKYKAVEHGMTFAIFSDGLLSVTGVADGSLMPHNASLLDRIGTPSFKNQGAQQTDITKLYIDCTLPSSGYYFFSNLRYVTKATFGPNFNSSNLTSMRDMFFQCEKLEELDMRTWDVSNVTEMYWAFSRCYAMKKIDLRGWDTSSVINVECVFENCGALEEILGISDLNTTNILSFYSMFSNCKSLTSLDLHTNGTKWNTSKCRNMNTMFYNCKSLTTLNLNGWNTSNVDGHFLGSGVIDPDSFDYGMNSMFESCEELTSINISHFDTAKAKGMEKMFKNCKKLTNLSLPNPLKTQSCKSISQMFYGCEKLETPIDISNCRTDVLTNVQSMFYNCKSIPSINAENFITSQITTLGTASSYYEQATGFFENCESLEAVNVRGWDTSNLTDTKYLFYNCFSLKELDLSDWDLGQVSETSFTLNGCDPYILKIPKKTGDAYIDLGYYNSSTEYYHTSEYYEEPSTGNKRYNNENKLRIASNLDQGSNPIITYYRKYKINYYDKNADISTDEPITSEYICPYNKYPTASSPETDKKISFIKSTTYPNAYAVYSIGDTGTIFDNNTNFTDDLTETNHLLNLRGVEDNKFKVTISSPLNLGSKSIPSTYSGTSTITYALKSTNDDYWVQVVPSTSTFTMQSGTKTATFTSSISNNKVKWSDVKSGTADTDGYKSTTRSLSVSGTINQPGVYSGNVILNITSGTD